MVEKDDSRLIQRIVYRHCIGNQHFAMLQFKHQTIHDLYEECTLEQLKVYFS